MGVQSNPSGLLARTLPWDGLEIGIRVLEFPTTPNKIGYTLLILCSPDTVTETVSEPETIAPHLSAMNLQVWKSSKAVTSHASIILPRT